MQKEKKQISWSVIFGFGLFIIFILYFPILYLNGNALLTMHDQLDGEVMSYVLTAKHWNENRIPELLGGVMKTAVTPPAPLSVVWYSVFSPKVAFFLNYLVVAIVAYLGMFLCLKTIFKHKFIAVSIGVIFAMLPFYSVYGLSVMGQPLLVYAVISMWEEKHICLNYWIAAFFAAYSSLILVGYADLGLLLLLVGYCYLAKKENRQKMLYMFLIMLAIYVCCNFQLLKEMLVGIEGFTPHKSELLAQSMPIREAFGTLLLEGQYHAASWHQKIVPIVGIVFFCGITGYRNLEKQEKKLFQQFVGILFCIFSIAILYAVWKFLPIVNLRNKLGGLFTSFQVDRFYWLYPMLWYLAFGFALYLIYALWNTKYLYALSRIVVCVLIVQVGCYVWDNSNVKINYQKLANDSYVKEGYETWDAFFGEELFDEIQGYIGQPQDSYKVASIGLYPSIPLYNGFYCIDGYSNNYDLNYKHKFRKIIAKELEKDESMKHYFDDWGNRCYLFPSEIPYRYYIGKQDNTVLKDLDIDIAQLKKMGCKYLMTTIPIEGEKLEITFEKKFETNKSPYCIYLYKIQEERGN